MRYDNVGAMLKNYWNFQMVTQRVNPSPGPSEACVAALVAYAWGAGLVWTLKE